MFRILQSRCTIHMKSLRCSKKVENFLSRFRVADEVEDSTLINDWSWRSICVRIHFTSRGRVPRRCHWRRWGGVIMRTMRHIDHRLGVGMRLRKKWLWCILNDSMRGRAIHLVISRMHNEFHKYLNSHSKCWQTSNKLLLNLTTLKKCLTSLDSKSDKRLPSPYKWN